MKFRIAIVATLFGLTTPVFAQSIPAADPNAADGAFLKYVTMDSVGEVQLCNLALQKSQDDAVKAFARRMIADHTAAIGRASALAKAANVADFAEQPADDAQIEYAHLSSYSGHEFDREFMARNVEDHQTDIDTTRHAMEVAKNADVKNFEMQQLPQLEEHLRLAQRTSDSVASRRD